MRSGRQGNDLVEVFGYAPDDLSEDAREFWALTACPFVGRACSKTNHDCTIVYGTCTVTAPDGDCIVCPNRLYEKDYAVIRRIAEDAFGVGVPILMYEEYLRHRQKPGDCVVVLGQHSGREVKLAKSFSMDWVLARISNRRLIEYTGVEAQSIDISGNYRDCWHAYRSYVPGQVVPRSDHGLNWANVHKRLIPQLIRKGLVYSRSTLVRSGIYFVVPEVVYRHFEQVVGADIPLVTHKGRDVVTVHTYALGPPVGHGRRRQLHDERSIRFLLDEFAGRFIAGANLPDGTDLDASVSRVLGL